MEEVIAQRTKKTPVKYAVCGIVCFAVALVFLIIFLCLFRANSPIAVNYFELFVAIIFLGFFVAIPCAVGFVKQYKKPCKLLVFKDGELHFYNGTVCKPCDITDCACSGEILGMGTISVYIADRKIELTGVENYAESCKRLKSIVYGEVNNGE